MRGTHCICLRGAAAEPGTAPQGTAPPGPLCYPVGTRSPSPGALQCMPHQLSFCAALPSTRPCTCLLPLPCSHGDAVPQPRRRVWLELQAEADQPRRQPAGPNAAAAGGAPWAPGALPLAVALLVVGRGFEPTRRWRNRGSGGGDPRPWCHLLPPARHVSPAGWAGWLPAASLSSHGPAVSTASASVAP